MENRNKDIIDLAMGVLHQLKEHGLADTTIDYNRSCLQTICRFCIAHGHTEYSPSIIQHYLQNLQNQVKKGEVSHSYANSLRRAAMLLEDAAAGKTAVWRRRNNGSSVTLSEYYESILYDFRNSLHLSESTLCVMCAILRKYLAYLETMGRKNIFEILSCDFPQYVVFAGISGRYLSSAKCFVKKLYNFLQETYGVSLTWQGILNEDSVPEIRIRPYTMIEELETILSQINRTTPKGKRDYAIVLLGAHTGLRAIDIVNLKLEDVDWHNFELHIIQKKTKRPLALPLTADAGEAIKDYILNGRPHSESEYIFLRTKAPHKRIESAVTLTQVFKEYQEKAGISRSAYDGRGFHSLRRGLGRSMVIAEIPITTIAQVLGHADIESSKPYLSLDTQNLKACALDFCGIEVEER